MGQPGRAREGNVDFPSRNGPPSPFLRVKNYRSSSTSLLTIKEAL